MVFSLSGTLFLGTCPYGGQRLSGCPVVWCCVDVRHCCFGLGGYFGGMATAVQLNLLQKLILICGFTWLFIVNKKITRKLISAKTHIFSVYIFLL